MTYYRRKTIKDFPKVSRKILSLVALLLPFQSQIEERNLETTNSLFSSHLSNMPRYNRESNRISISLNDYKDGGLRAMKKDRRNQSSFGMVGILPVESVTMDAYTAHYRSPILHQLADLTTAVAKGLEAKPYFLNIEFEPNGCEFCAILSHDETPVPQSAMGIGGGDERDHYWVHIMILSNNMLDAAYCVEMHLMAPTQKDDVVGNEATAKNMFSVVCYAIQREVRRLEFPNFPDGNSGQTFKSVYQLNQELNVGSFAIVFRGRHRKTGRVVAIKSVNRTKLAPADDAAIFMEVALMANMDHPHIVKVHDFFEEPEWYLIVLEYLSGGDLFDRIGAKQAYNEKDARDLTIALLSSVNYCHRDNIAHLDLKSKNLLLSSDEDDTSVKLADFGFAQRVMAPNSLSRRCGTPFFVAPEIIRKEAYDQRADMWSCGVIIYLLLSGRLPFTGMNAQELFSNVLRGNLEFPVTEWENITTEAKLLCKKLLDRNPETRMTAKQALTSAWIQKDAVTLKTHDLASSSKRLKTFNAKMKLKAAVHAIGFSDAIRGNLKFRCEKSGRHLTEEEIDTDMD